MKKLILFIILVSLCFIPKSFAAIQGATIQGAILYNDTATSNYILMETGDKLLLETGDKIIGEWE